MPNPNKFTLHSGYASFKNEIGSTTLSVTLPAGQSISPGGTFTDTDTATLGSQGSSIYARISPNKGTYSGKYFASSTLVEYRTFEISGTGGATNEVAVVAFVNRPSATQVRLTLGVANPNPATLTNQDGSITFTANVQTYLSPFEE